MGQCAGWQVYIPESRDNFNPFKFESSLNSMFGEQARDVFGGLIQFLQEVGQRHNPDVQKIGFVRQKDEIHKNGQRATYVWDESQQKFGEKPKEVISKNKKQDINVTKGQSLILKTDLRISINYEQHFQSEEYK